MKLYLITILLLITGIYTTTAQNRIEALDQYFSALYQNQQFNGNILIAEKGKIIYEKSFGYADFTRKILLHKNSTFPIASLTKTITATAVLQLKDQGKLAITDLVTKYIPEFPYPTLTIRHLLSHTSGLPISDDLFFPISRKKPDTIFMNTDLLATMINAKLPLVFKPGEDFSYNNINYNVLALLIERISGLPFETYLQQNIFNPAGMRQTSSSWLFSRKDKNFVERYRFKYSFSPAMERADSAAEFSGAEGMYRFNMSGQGDLISNTRDLLNYDQAFYKGRLLSQEVMKEAFSPVKLKNGNDNIQRYALGWMIPADTSMGYIVKHDGGLPGARSLLLRNLSKKQTIILLDNTNNNVIPYGDIALKIINGIRVEKPKISGAKIYGTILANSGLTAIKERMPKLRKDTSTYYFDENELNSLGYEMMYNQHEKEALEVFKLNTELFPTSWNVYDSYAEILLKEGKKAEAIKLYQKSLELNPENENGKKVLTGLLK